MGVTRLDIRRSEIEGASTAGTLTVLPVEVVDH
jgi:hypothetical protein